MTRGSTAGIRVLVLVLLTVAVLLGGASLMAADSNPGPYAFVAGTISGGRYRLTLDSWRVTGAATGQDYTLTPPAESTLLSGECCCTSYYLPCVLRQGP